MEHDGSDYYIHCIYMKSDHEIRYLRISPDFEGTAIAQRINENGETYNGFEATWLGTATMQIGDNPKIDAYESYFAGSVEWYKAF